MIFWGQCLRINGAEKKEWERCVKVAFQPNSGYDENIMKSWFSEDWGNLTAIYWKDLVCRYTQSSANYPADTSRTSSERLMFAQFTSFVYRVVVSINCYTRSWGPATLLKRDSNTVFSFAICETFTNMHFFTEQLEQLLQQRFLIYLDFREKCRWPFVSTNVTQTFIFFQYTAVHRCWEFQILKAMIHCETSL